MSKTGIILAAGEGKRMKSDVPKVLHNAGGAPMIDWVLNAMRGAGISDIVVVVGKDAREIREYLGDSVRYAVQEERLGSGNAAMAALGYVPREAGGYTFVAAGDMPVLTADTISAMFRECINESYDCMLLSAIVHDPSGYGRVVRTRNGDVAAIVEHRDATEEEKRINEINASCYCVRTDLLHKHLPALSCDNAQGEYYLTDIVDMIHKDGGTVAAFVADETECMGVNDRVQLAEASGILYTRTARRHMENGVTIVDPATTYIDPATDIGRDTVIYPGVILEQGCRIGAGAVMYQGSRISHSKIGDRTQVQNSVVLDSAIGSECTIGPYAYLRPQSEVGNNCRVGDFVELKNCKLGNKTKVSHLTYIGDADFGSDINVGCGTVVVNYDGSGKYRSVVKDGAFIGCNTNLISPVEVGERAYIAAGSTITEDVPSETLAVARARQIIKHNWKDKRRSSAGK